MKEEMPKRLLKDVPGDKSVYRPNRYDRAMNNFTNLCYQCSGLNKLLTAFGGEPVTKSEANQQN